MKHAAYFTIVLVSLFGAYNAQNRIVGGMNATSKIAPYTVSFQNVNKEHVCGGAIISEYCIISAAHCFVGAEPEYVFAMVGTIYLNKGGTVYNVSKIVIHQNYSTETKENDIALVFTSQQIIFSTFVRRINVLARSVSDGEQLTFTGFGKVDDQGEPSTILQVINLTAFNLDTCKFAYRNIRKLFDSQMCTFNSIGQGTCHGDSGAPLVMDSNLVGIASFGIPCAVGYPDVFTRTITYVPWIRQNIFSYYKYNRH